MSNFEEAKIEEKIETPQKLEIAEDDKNGENFKNGESFGVINPVIQNSDFVDMHSTLDDKKRTKKHSCSYYIKWLLLIIVVIIFIVIFYHVGYNKGKENALKQSLTNSQNNNQENKPKEEERPKERPKEEERPKERPKEEERPKDKPKEEERPKEEDQPKKDVRGKGLKLAMCVVGKDENKYINEFVDYYRDLGFDKIFLYDNNYKNDTQRFIHVLKKDVEDGFVEIAEHFDIQDETFQIIAYNDCYKKHGNDYDWFFIGDIDEYLNIKHNRTVREYLGLEQFNKCQGIRISWITYGDNGLVYYQPIPVQIRFKEPAYATLRPGVSGFGKTIVRGHLDMNKVQMHVHRPIGLDYCCDNNGEKIQTTSESHKNNWDQAGIRHYSYKTAEEFVDKLIRFKYGRVDKSDFKEWAKRRVIKDFFGLNNVTSEKIEVFERGFGINLDSLKK